MKKIRVGTRKSNLALRQVEELETLLKESGIAFELEVIGFETSGDKDKLTPLTDLDGTDFFTDTIENALIENKIDLAIHSAKDLPWSLCPGTGIAAVTKGIDSADTLVTRNMQTLDELPAGSRIGTSSKRRQSQLRELRADLELVEIRGTIEERLEWIAQDRVDGVIVAAAALIRLGLDNRIAQRLPFKTPILQGKLACQTRNSDVELNELLGRIDDRNRWGTISIIGAGPGDPGLITCRGMETLKRADIIFTDALVSRQLLKNAKGKQVYVGKRAGKHSASQEEIHDLLAEASLAGKKTVRLKGGDPYVFGRSAEEVDFLNRNLIPHEVIPGISAFQAAAAYAGLPLTERGVSSTFAVCNGHQDRIPVPACDSLIYYMGVGNAQKIFTALRENGHGPDTPVAYVSNASQPGQKVYRCSLGEATEDRYQPEMPALILAGKTALPRPESSWFEKRPKILFTGTVPDRYRHLGELTHQQMIQLSPAPLTEDIHGILNNLTSHTHLIFTSKHAVHFFFASLAQINRDVRSLCGLTVYAIGKVTGKELGLHGIIPDDVPHFETAEGLTDLIREKQLKDKSFLIPQSNLSHPDLEQHIREMGNLVTCYTSYINTMPENLEKLDLTCYDMVVFTSPSTVRNFRKLYGRIPDHLTIHAIGPVTRDEIENGESDAG